MRTALYLRVSTDEQVDRYGLQAQHDQCEAMARVKEWEVVATFKDEGVSGTLGVEHRPGLGALLKVANDGTIDAVIVGALDRLGRDTGLILNLVNLLDDLGTEFVSCRETFDTTTAFGQFTLTIFAAMAQIDRDNIRERMMSGMRKSVEAGNVLTAGGLAPYGYDHAQENGNKTLVINEEQAKIVREIFRRYATGEDTINGIAKFLTERGVPTPRGGKGPQSRTKFPNRWSDATIAGLLKNETYVGRWAFGKTRRVVTKDGKPKNMRQPRSQWVINPVPLIVDEATFKLVQQRRKKNRAQLSGRRKYDYALSGMLKCGSCADQPAVTGRSKLWKSKTKGLRLYSSYYCSRRYKPKLHGGKCELPPVKAADIENAVWNWVSEVLTKPGELRKRWERQRDHTLKGLKPLTNMLLANDRRIAKLEAEKDRLIQAYAAGVLTLDEIDHQKTDLVRNIEELAKANRQLRGEIEDKSGQVDFDALEKFVARLDIGTGKSAGSKKVQHEFYRRAHLSGMVTYDGERHFAEIACILGREVVPIETNKL